MFTIIDDEYHEESDQVPLKIESSHVDTFAINSKEQCILIFYSNSREITEKYSDTILKRLYLISL